MSEEKKEKIIVDIEEHESTKIDGKNNIVEISGKGTLSVKNPSQESRLWNLDLKIDDLDFTNLPAEESNEALEPGSSWDFDYEVENLKEPILQLKEVFDTSKDEEGVNQNFVKLIGKDPASINITLTNVSEKSIQDIELKKVVPAYLTNVKILKTAPGEANFDMDSKNLIWNIKKLGAEKTAELLVEGIPEIKDSSIKSGNEVDVTYTSDMNQRSKIQPSIEALTDTMTGIDKEEDDSKPGWWNCEIEFENESDFEVTVKSLIVTKPDSLGGDDIVNISPADVVPPHEFWTHDFSVESPSVPTINTKLDFTANFEVPTRIIGQIKKEASTFEVLETSVKKVIDPPKVKANANTNMQITDTITNEGTAPIDKLSFQDKIPKDFEAPGYEQIKSHIENAQGGEVAVLGKQYATLALNPEDKEVGTPHEINIAFKNMEEVFKPGHKLVVSYPIIARNPQPNTRYETPVHTKSYTKVKGPAYEDTTPEMPVIGIKYVKRKVKTAKSISPAGKEGAFRVAVRIDNKGGVELENIKMVETLPPGFNASNFKPKDMEPEFKKEDEGAKLIWRINRLDAGKRIKFKYIAEGSGEFPRTEPRVIIAEPESIKSAESAKSKAEQAPAVSEKDEEFKEKHAGPIHEIMTSLKDRLNQIMNAESAAAEIEKTRDEVISSGKSSPVLHEFMTKARELKKLGNKMIVGSKLDALLKDIDNWEGRLIG